MSWPPASLTVRLGLLFGAIALVTFAAVGTYLYRSLAAQLDERDDAELLGKIELVRHLLTETESTAMIRRDPHLFQDATVGHEGLLFAIKSSSNEVLIENTYGKASFPKLTMVPADRKPAYSDIAAFKTHSGQPGRMIAAWGRVGGEPGAEVQIIVARETSDRSAFLSAYLRDLLVAIVGGALLITLLGHLVARRGLRPVRQIAAKAHQITASSLDARLGLPDAPAEMRELVDAFNQMLDRVQEGVERLSQFSSDLAHDLRTPIANLLGETQVALARSRTPEQYQALLESNVEELERVSRMIENMLFLARADNAQLAIRPEVLDAASEVARIADYFEGIAAEAGVRIALDGSGTVTADRTLFQRAVSNLLLNAIRHTPPRCKVMLSISASPKGVSISVKNPGPAIPLDQQPHVFDRFFRGDNSRSHSSSSSGLGLAIVKSIMALHRGSVSLHSAEGVGTTFTLIFP